MVRGLLRTSFLIILVVALMIGVSGVVSADNMGIECLETPGVFYYPNHVGIIDQCTVVTMVAGESLQRVDVATPLNPDNTLPLSEWIFNNLTIPDGFTFNIGNHNNAPRAETIQSYGGCGSNNGGYNPHSSWCFSCGDCRVGGEGGIPGSDEPSIYRDGGAGGNGGSSSDSKEGGGGGAGGVGGKQFYIGGTGGVGGAGGDGKASGGQYTSTGWSAGANVRIIVRDTLTFGENSKLSVSGDDGTECESWNHGGEHSHSEGGGAGGAPGGNGGGSLVLFVNKINNGDNSISYGTLAATGGRGGPGCNGGGDKGSNNDEGGGGGGAGGGGDGGSVSIYYLESDQEFPITSINVSPGATGVPGFGPDGADSGLEGMPGESGSTPTDDIANENLLGSCTDKIDNDFDNLIDFQDSDCFNLLQPEVEWDNNGPIPGIINPPGATDYSAYPIWDPVYSNNGSDAICGDDLGGCVPKNPCDIDSCDNNFCVSDNDFQSCEGETVYCSIFEDPQDGSCVDEPPFCYETKVCLSGYDPNCPYDTFTCDGNAPCENLLENECGDYGVCTSNNDISECTQIFSCEEQTDESTCNSSYCDYYSLGSTDQSYVAISETTGEGLRRYYCGQDNNTLIDIPPSASSAWKWWDAYEQGTSFLIHNYDNIDYIANGQEWFYCNANQSNIHNVGSNALPVAEGENFSSSVYEGGFTCVEALTAAGTYFTDDGWDSSGWEGYFDYCDPENPEDTWCCNLTNSDGDVPGFGFDANGGFQNSLEFDDDCGQYCYYNDSLAGHKVNRALSNFEPSYLIEEYCNIYYYDPTCLHNEDSPLFGEISVGLFEKKSCGFDMTGCLSPNLALDQNCSDISQTRLVGSAQKIFNGTLCNRTTYCGGTQEYLLSWDVNPENPTYTSENPICCLGEEDAGSNICIPYEAPFGNETCVQAGGDWLFETPVANYYCEGGVVYDNSCCLGGTWVPRWEELMYQNLAQPDSFICYDHQNQNRFAECCTDFTKCYNSEIPSPFSDANPVNLGYYGKGGALHTLSNFDMYKTDDETGSELLLDLMRVRQLKSDETTDFVTFNLNAELYDFSNWENFDYLEFDIAFNMNRVTSVMLEDVNGNFTYFNNFTDYLVTGKEIMRWHHVVVPLSEDNNTDNFDFLNVEKIYLRTDYSQDGLYVAVDAFLLSEKSNKLGGKLFTDNYYCTGNFGNWIMNLDGETDKGFLDGELNTYDLEDYGKYWYACEAQASFDWTGHACCGDDTRNSHYSTTNAGEYYEDSAAGCFHGNTVPSNTLVGYVLNDIRYNNLIFYGEEFFACVEEDYLGANKTISYNGSGELTGDGNLIKDGNSLPAYSVKGDYICDEVTHDWIPLSSISRARIIASKMYNLTFVNTTHKLSNYNIYCDDMTSVSPGKNMLGSEYSLLRDQIIDFCTLTYVAEGTGDHLERVMIGLSLDYDNAYTDESFFTIIYSHLEDWGLTVSGNPQDLEDLKDSCSAVAAGSNNETDFFQYCDNYKGELYLRYNPDFKILFMSFKADPLEDFNGFFYEDAKLMDYVRNYWNNFIGLFNGWFGGGNQAGENIIWTNQTIVPLFASDGDIYAQNVIELNQVYISSKGTKEIRGFTEQRYATENTQSNPDTYLAMQYIGFENSVEFIANRYYGTPDYYQNLYELNYFVGDNSQFIVIVNATQAADVSFEPNFDWRRTGPMLRVDGTQGTQGFQALPNNGVVDFGEWCDYDENGENPVFKFGRSDCGFWNETHTGGDVGCNSLDQTLNHINCVVTVPTVCEDFELGYFCETPTFTHYTNIDVNGCKSICQSEGLSCCMYDSSGGFCYGNDAQQIVSSNPSFKAANRS